MAFELHKFTPLPGPDYIRLVTIRPRRKSDISIGGTPIIDFSLKTVALGKAPNFNALSYTWGSPFKRDSVSWAPRDAEHGVEESYDPKTSKWPVSIDGKLLFVTKNLYEGLKIFQIGVTLRSAMAEEAGVSSRQKDEEMALLDAVKDGRITDIERLLLNPTNILAEDDSGKTALHYAAENGFAVTSKLLIDAGANADRRDQSGRTPRDYIIADQKGDWEETFEMLRAVETLLPADDAVPEGPMWIDAICINQTDAAERSAQVAIMSEIYSTAKDIFVWLGVEDKSALLAIKTLRVMNSMPQEAREWTWTANAHLNLPQEEDKDFDETEEAYSIRQSWISDSLPGFEALLVLLDRAWFQRVWIMQEITMANRVTLKCGPYSIAWDELFSAVQRAYHPCDDPVCNRGRLLSYKFSPAIKFNVGNRGSEARVLTEVRLRTRIDIDYRKSLQDENQSLSDSLNKVDLSTAVDAKISLSLLLACSWHFNAQDPRDKVFALLGMAKQEDRDRVIVDYELSVSQVYRSVAPIFLAGSGSDFMYDLKSDEKEGLEPFEGLSFIQRSSMSRRGWPARTPDLPSWVPDFNQPLISARIFRTRFRAASNKPILNPYIEMIGNVFKVQGLIIDRVAAVAEESSQEPGTNSLFFHLESWLRLTHSLKPTYAATGQNRAEVLWRTLMLDETAPVGDKRAKQSFQEWVEMFSLELYHSRRVRDLYEELRATDSSDSLIQLGEFLHEEAGRRMGVRCVNYTPKHDGSFYYLWVAVDLTRRLFTTENGYMGLGPGTMEPGDVVVLIAGARTPFILRPQKEPSSTAQYQFVGEAYLHGIMNGEAALGREDAFETLELI